MQHGLCTDCARYDSRITQLNGKNKDTCKKCKWLNCGVGGDYWNGKEEGKKVEETRQHSNCKYDSLSIINEPCRSCFEESIRDDRKFWQPKEKEQAMAISTPHINTTARDAVAAALRECAGEYAKRFEVAIAAIEQADKPEVVMVAKKVLLAALVGKLPLNSSTCYFCQIRNGSCANCEYAKYHGKCMDEGGDYLRIKPEKTRLLEAIASYYNGESYDTEHAEYMRLKAKFEE